MSAVETESWLVRMTWPLVEGGNLRGARLAACACIQGA